MFDNAGGEKGWMITRLGVGEQWTPGGNPRISCGALSLMITVHITPA